jgi:hypothetical protein
MKYLFLPLTTFFVVFLSIIAVAGQHETCIQKGGQHKAHYHCPDGYEAIIAGEGTYECDGECYIKGDKGSLKKGISRLIERRFGSEVVKKMSDDEISIIVDGLLKGKRYRIEKYGATLELRL